MSGIGLGRARVPRRLASTLVVLLLLVGGGCGDDAVASPAGIVRAPAPVVADTALPDASTAGRPFAMRAQPNEVLVVYFGFTSCPDVCPTTMADLKDALEDLGEEASRVDFAMITVDPGRDDGENLDNYVHAFFDRAHALRTEDDRELRAAADAFGADYAVRTAADGSIEVSHTAFLYAVDSRGRIVLQWAFGTSSEDLASDLEFLLEGGMET